MVNELTLGLTILLSLAITWAVVLHDKVQRLKRECAELREDRTFYKREFHRMQAERSHAELQTLLSIQSYEKRNYD